MSNRRGFNPDARVKDAAFAFRVLSDSVFTKGFLGRSLREDRGLPSVGVSSARRAGVIVDDNGKMRCPPGTPNANQFTDINMSNCMIPSAETLAQQAADAAKNALSKAADGFKRGPNSGHKKDRDIIPNASLATPDADGFLDLKSRPKSVTVVSPLTGKERRLDTVDDSIAHVAEGGKLSDIPDEHLLRSISENIGEGKRFKLIGEGGGVNGMDRLEDGSTGALIGVKYIYRRSQREQEPMNEIISELFSEHFGYEPMVMRAVPRVLSIDNPQNPLKGVGESWDGVGIVTELAHNRNAGKIGAAYEFFNQSDFPLESVFRMAVLDAVIANTDRHDGNVLYSVVDDKFEIIPIDHSLSLGYDNDNKTPEQMAENIGTIWRPAPSNEIMKHILELQTKHEDEEAMRDAVLKMAKVQEDARNIDVEKLRKQIDAVYSLFGTFGISPSEQDRKNHDAAIRRLEAIGSSTPEKMLAASMWGQRGKPYSPAPVYVTPLEIILERQQRRAAGRDNRI